MSARDVAALSVASDSSDDETAPPDPPVAAWGTKPPAAAWAEGDSDDSDEPEEELEEDETVAGGAGGAAAHLPHDIVLIIQPVETEEDDVPCADTQATIVYNQLMQHKVAQRRVKLVTVRTAADMHKLPPAVEETPTVYDYRTRVYHAGEDALLYLIKYSFSEFNHFVDLRRMLFGSGEEADEFDMGAEYEAIEVEARRFRQHVGTDLEVTRGAPRAGAEREEASAVRGRDHQLAAERDAEGSAFGGAGAPRLAIGDRAVVTATGEIDIVPGEDEATEAASGSSATMDIAADAKRRQEERAAKRAGGPPPHVRAKIEALRSATAAESTGFGGDEFGGVEETTTLMDEEAQRAERAARATRRAEVERYVASGSAEERARAVPNSEDLERRVRATEGGDASAAPAASRRGRGAAACRGGHRGGR